jgi:hypothetical protein
MNYAISPLLRTHYVVVSCSYMLSILLQLTSDSWVVLDVVHIRLCVLGRTVKANASLLVQISLKGHVVLRETEWVANTPAGLCIRSLL